MILRNLYIRGNTTCRATQKSDKDVFMVSGNMSTYPFSLLCINGRVLHVNSIVILTVDYRCDAVLYLEK
jgi:hypothetical protein